MDSPRSHRMAWAYGLDAGSSGPRVGNTSCYVRGMGARTKKLPSCGGSDVQVVRAAKKHWRRMMEEIEKTITIPVSRLMWAFWSITGKPDRGSLGDGWHSPKQQEWLDWASNELHKSGHMKGEMTDEDMSALFSEH